MQYCNFNKCMKMPVLKIEVKVMPLSTMHDLFSCLVHQWQQQHQTSNDHAQQEKLNTALSTRTQQFQHLRQSHNFMLFARTPLVTSSNANDVNGH